MRVFVTGHKGYIGAHLVDLLKGAGHHVTGCDVGLFEDCAWDTCITADRELIRDVRALTERDLDGHDCVMHLAAISNDPMGEMDPTLTNRINRDASVELAAMAKKAGVGRFLFSGSCAVYGRLGSSALGEEDPVDPLTAYARTKVEAEAGLSELADQAFATVSLRNATAYGYSPMLRIDLVVNNLLACAHAMGEIRIMSDGSPWRPLIHCRDIARAFVAFMEAPAGSTHHTAVNVGANAENYQVRDVAGQVQRLMPEAQISYTGEAGSDARDYRVNFDRLNALLPSYKLEYTLATGMADLHRRMIDHGFDASDFHGDRFVRLRTLGKQLGRLAAQSS